jgi:hypothetical protein
VHLGRTRNEFFPGKELGDAVRAFDLVAQV